MEGRFPISWMGAPVDWQLVSGPAVTCCFRVGCMRWQRAQRDQSAALVRRRGDRDQGGIVPYGGVLPAYGGANTVGGPGSGGSQRITAVCVCGWPQGAEGSAPVTGVGRLSGAAGVSTPMPGGWRPQGGADPVGQGPTPLDGGWRPEVDLGSAQWHGAWLTPGREWGGNGTGCLAAPRRRRGRH